MSETPQQQSLWRPIERKCLALLQRRNTRNSLLQIHAFMLRNATDTNVNLLTKFVMACASLNLAVSPSDPLACISHARRVFDHTPHRDDTFLSNSMIKAHLSMRQFAESLSLYTNLRRNASFVPDSFTFTALANSCGLNMSTLEGLQIHDHVIKYGFCFDLYVSTALLDMYAKLGKMVWARNMFDDMIERSQVSWTALICGYARSGDMNHARKLFEEMPEERDSVLYNAMIDGYVKLGDMSSARTLFDEMPDRNVISWTSMIYGYCNHGDVGSARSLFDAMPDKNLFSWNAMIGGYCQNKQPHEALTLFQNMQQRTSLQPDIVTLVSILPAIADLGALDLGEWVHSFARRKRLDRAINLCTALVDMYAKCGEITKARRVFDEMREKEIASWNAMINGYAVNGHGKEALEVFMDMQLEGVKPNDITMLAVLSACNHGGLVKEGKRWFEKMEEFGLTPKIEHYGCTIDLLGRAGYLDEAENLMRSMPYKANGIILSSFLSACGYSYDVTRAKTVLNKAINMEPYNDGNYVMLRNLYAAEKRWRDAEEIKGLMRRNGAKKEVGCSVIEVDCMVSEFVSGDRAHPQWDLIQLVLGQLWMHMKGKGFTQLEQD